MRLQENPFYILGVTPEHSVAEIDEIKEDRCFEDETREAEYEEARDILANPRKRILAEVRWICEKNTRVFAAIDSLYIIRDKHLMKEVPQRIRDIDSIYAKYANPEAASFLLYEINEGRTKARMAQIDGQDMAADAIRDAMVEDFRAAAAVFCSQIPLENLVEIANTLAEDVIRPSIGVFPKKYSEIVRIFIDLYHAQTQSRLEEDCQKVMDAIEKAKDTEERLSFAYTTVQNFEKIAKPLQIYFRDIGQVRNQKETQEIERALRSLAVYYNNEKGMPTLSLSITKFCLETFTEDPEFIKISQDDQVVLETLVKEYQAYEKRRADEKNSGKISGCFGLLLAFLVLFIFMRGCSSSSDSPKESKPAVSSTVQKEEETTAPEMPVTIDEGIRYAEPPAGNGRVLSDDEMHWVAREQIRIEKMRSLVQTNEGIDELNRRIDNYNARASHFRYKRHSWDYAKEAVEKYRAEIEAEIEQEVWNNGW